MVLVPIGDVAFAYRCERKCLRELESAINQGAVSVEGINQQEFVERPEITLAIEKVLCPAMWYHGYDLIIGNHGTGKTSLVRNIGHCLSGIIYVDIPLTRKGFDAALVKALR